MPRDGMLTGTALGRRGNAAPPRICKHAATPALAPRTRAAAAASLPARSQPPTCPLQGHSLCTQTAAQGGDTSGRTPGNKGGKGAAGMRVQSAGCTWHTRVQNGRPFQVQLSAWGATAARSGRKHHDMPTSSPQRPACACAFSVCGGHHMETQWRSAHTCKYSQNTQHLVREPAIVWRGN